MKRLILAASAFALSVAVVHADPVEDREKLMKSFGKEIGALAPVAKGEKPFDAAQVQATFKALDEHAKLFDAEALFPKDVLGESAAPKIWEDWPGFLAAVDKFKADVAAAAAETPADLAAFQATFGKVAGNCGACHEVYRVKKG